MNKENRITEILGIKYSIIQGVMSLVTTAEFVSAVINAKGLGMFGPYTGQKTNPKSVDEITDRLRSEIRKVKQLLITTVLSCIKRLRFQGFSMLHSPINHHMGNRCKCL